MSSILKPMNALTVLSIIQLVLALIGIVILLSAPLMGYEQRVFYYYDYDTGVTHYAYHSYGFFVNENSVSFAAAIGIAIMYLVFLYFSLFRILSSNLVRILPLNRKLSKHAKLTPLLGVGIIGLGCVGAIIGLSSLSDITGYWLEAGAVSVLSGGVIVAVTGILANRMSRSAVQTAYGYASQPLVQPTVSYPPQPSYPCPTCGRPLNYVQQYNRWYCYNCQKYV